MSQWCPTCHTTHIAGCQAKPGFTPFRDPFSTSVHIDRAGLFEFLKHGDEKHQAWLREAIDAYFDGQPRPEPK